jgi:hypothetical protein
VLGIHSCYDDDHNSRYDFVHDYCIGNKFVFHERKGLFNLFKERLGCKTVKCTYALNYTYTMFLKSQQYIDFTTN